MPTVTVVHEKADQFTVRVRDHEVTVDQPVADGGDDTGPTPTELFVAGLAACVAFYARRYLARHRLPDQDVEVVADFTMAARPARVADVHITLAVSPTVPAERLEGLLAVASHCTVHNSLTVPPAVTVNMGVTTG
jgi:putative redox protein